MTNGANERTHSHRASSHPIGDRERKQQRRFLSCFPTHTALSRAIGICIFEAYSNCIGRTSDLDSLDSNYFAFQGVGDLLHTTTHQSTWLGRHTEGGTRERQRLAIFTRDTGSNSTQPVAKNVGGHSYPRVLDSTYGYAKHISTIKSAIPSK